MSARDLSEPLVLLPDLLCDARLFAPQVAALSARATIVTRALDLFIWDNARD